MCSALAKAELGEVLAEWAGLGYYARARNLHACAREVADRYGGKFPATEAELRTLPGIGGYTAAAIAAIAFGASRHAGRRQYRARGGAALRRRRRRCRRQARARASWRRRSRRSERAGDFAQGHDGSWRHDLHALGARLAAFARCGRIVPAMRKVLPKFCPIAAGEGERGRSARRRLRGVAR